MAAGASHAHDSLAQHFHSGSDAAEHGHTHEIYDGPGSYMARELPLNDRRDWADRAFTIGIGGYAALLRDISSLDRHPGVTSVRLWWEIIANGSLMLVPLGLGRRL